MCASCLRYVFPIGGVLAVLSAVGGCGRVAGDDAESGQEAAAESASAVQEQFVANYDIGMTVRSVANTINIGEKLDSTDYNFAGVLTDGVGMPLFTDFSGMPGEWEIEVIDSVTVCIRNLDAGNLHPFELIDYIASNLEGESQPLLLQGESDRGEAHIVTYRYGRTSISVETRPMNLENTGDVAPEMHITLKAGSDSIPAPDEAS